VHSADLLIDLEALLPILLVGTLRELKVFDEQACVDVKAADTSLGIADVNHPVLCIKGH
jgi:hypothetical protein